MIIIEQLKKVKDTRSHINQVYPVMEVAFLVITAMICGQNKWTDIKDFGEGNIEWLREYLPYDNGLPTRHNIAAIMRTVVPETLLEAMVGWVNLHREKHAQPIISVTVYAALSQRCDRLVLEDYADRIGYERVISFQTHLPSGAPVYHTNVMMSVGEQFCVICDEVIPEFERRFVIKSLAKDKQVISISLAQMNQFCGNILQLETADGGKVIAMSQSAHNAFSAAQKKQLATHGKLLPFDVSTIESIGGGSVRCLLGEVFLPSYL